MDSNLSLRTLILPGDHHVSQGPFENSDGYAARWDGLEHIARPSHYEDEPRDIFLL